MSASKNNNWFFVLVALIIGAIFFNTGYGKLSGGEFVNGLANTLTFFASKNPYPWVQGMITDIIIPNSIVFGYLTMWGELLTGLSILIAVAFYLFQRKFNRFSILLLAAGFITGAFLNWTFWFASGWTSPSASSLNLLMGFIQTAGIVYLIRQYRQIK